MDPVDPPLDDVNQSADADDLGIEEPTGRGGSLVVIPETPDGFLKPKPSSLIGEMATMQRHPEHYEQIMLPMVKVVSGLSDSRDGPKWSYAKAIIDLQAACQLNGYRLLAKASLPELSRAFKFAWRRNTGQPFYRLEKQGVRLRLEHKRNPEPEAQPQAAE